MAKRYLGEDDQQQSQDLARESRERIYALTQNQSNQGGIDLRGPVAQYNTKALGTGSSSYFTLPTSQSTTQDFFGTVPTTAAIQQPSTRNNEWDERIRLFIESQRLTHGDEVANLYQRMSPRSLVTSPGFLDFLIRPHTESGNLTRHPSYPSLQSPSALGFAERASLADEHSGNALSLYPSSATNSYQSLNGAGQVDARLTRNTLSASATTADGYNLNGFHTSTGMWQMRSEHAALHPSSLDSTAFSSMLPSTSTGLPLASPLYRRMSSSHPYSINTRAPSSRKAATQWSHEEERILVEKIFDDIKPAWTVLAKYLPGHDANNIRKHWTTMRKRLLRRPDPAFFDELDSADGNESSPSTTNITLLSTSVNPDSPKSA